MTVVLVDIGFGLATLALGMIAGWWLRSRGRKSAAGPGDDEVRRAHEVLACLQRMASHVAREVGQHSSRVEEINEELASGTIREPAKIVHVVTKLIDANKSMQGRLDQAEDQLRQQARLVESHAAEARTDALTLVGNRRALDDQIARCLDDFQRRGQVFAVVMIDLDKFKRFNDTYGHQVGDEVLRGVARILQRSFRETDIVARYGGEEFAVLLPGVSPEEARTAAARARKMIERAGFHFDGRRFQVTASFGIAEVRRGEDAAGLIHRADEALYACKNAGRNCAHWHDGLEATPLGDDGEWPWLPASSDHAQQRGLSVDGARSAPDGGPAAERQDGAATVPQDDSLAELLNRTAFCQHVRSRMAEWKRGGPALSLVLAEIDRGGLPAHDGRQGCEASMDILTRTVLAMVRQMDLVAHYSSSCLAFLLPAARLGDAVAVAERIRKLVRQQPVTAEECPPNFTVSLGVIEVSEKDDLVGLFHRAEAALDAGRQSGGNCTHFHDGERCSLATPPVEAACPG
jgi:diguanylate cyclase (GGDEF)-like protein